jgi:hypothetical protein
VDPYKGGKSALDKAAELFFFTEILRGMCLRCFHIFVVLSLSVTIVVSKACGSSVNRSSDLHTPSCKFRHSLCKTPCTNSILYSQVSI